MDRCQIAEMLQQLVTADGPTGAEGRVAALVQELLRPLVDEIRTDALGNVIARRAARPGRAAENGDVTPPGRLMLAAHMDEIGLIVTRVDRGFLHVGRIGGVDPRSLLAQEVMVYPSGRGCDQFPAGIPGFIGSRPPHVLSPEDREQVVPLGDLRIDLGLSANPEGDEPRLRGHRLDELVRVGDRVAVCGPYVELQAGRVAAKAMDNRASLSALLAALAYLSASYHRWDVYVVATVQEETGSKGAVTAAYGLEPDIAIVLDVTFGDTPGTSDDETVPMDKGPAIGWGPNLHPAIVNRLRATARTMELSTVDEPISASSGTDAWGIQVVRSGIPCGLLSIPIRYMHSAVELGLVADIDRTARLLAAFAAELDDRFLPSLPEEV